MLASYNQALVPYTTGTITMVPGASGYVLPDEGHDSGNLELAYSPSRTLHRMSRIENEDFEATYTWNRRPSSFGMSDVGSFIDIYA